MAALRQSTVIELHNQQRSVARMCVSVRAPVHLCSCSSLELSIMWYTPRPLSTQVCWGGLSARMELSMCVCDSLFFFFKAYVRTNRRPHLQGWGEKAIYKQGIRRACCEMSQFRHCTCWLTRLHLHIYCAYLHLFISLSVHAWMHRPILCCCMFCVHARLVWISMSSHVSLATYSYFMSVCIYMYACMDFSLFCVNEIFHWY